MGRRADLRVSEVAIPAFADEAPRFGPQTHSLSPRVTIFRPPCHVDYVCRQRRGANSHAGGEVPVRSHGASMHMTSCHATPNSLFRQACSAATRLLSERSARHAQRPHGVCPTVPSGARNRSAKRANVPPQTPKGHRNAQRRPICFPTCNSLHENHNKKLEGGG